jgi:phage tail tape-measure protein
MLVQFVKPQLNPATVERVAEVMLWVDQAARSTTPAVQRACQEMGRALRAAGNHGPA